MISSEKTIHANTQNNPEKKIRINPRAGGGGGEAVGPQKTSHHFVPTHVLFATLKLLISQGIKLCNLSIKLMLWSDGGGQINQNANRNE